MASKIIEVNSKGYFKDGRKFQIEKIVSLNISEDGTVHNVIILLSINGEEPANYPLSIITENIDYTSLEIPYSDLETKKFLDVNDIVLCKIDLVNEVKDIAKDTKEVWYQDFKFLVKKDKILDRQNASYLKGTVSQISDGSAEIILDTGLEKTCLFDSSCLLYQSSILLFLNDNL